MKTTIKAILSFAFLACLLILKAGKSQIMCSYPITNNMSCKINLEITMFEGNWCTMYRPSL